MNSIVFVNAVQRTDRCGKSRSAVSPPPKHPYRDTSLHFHIIELSVVEKTKPRPLALVFILKKDVWVIVQSLDLWKVERHMFCTTLAGIYFDEPENCGKVNFLN